MKKLIFLILPVLLLLGSCTSIKIAKDGTGSASYSTIGMPDDNEINAITKQMAINRILALVEASKLKPSQAIKLIREIRQMPEKDYRIWLRGNYSRYGFRDIYGEVINSLMTNWK